MTRAKEAIDSIEAAGKARLAAAKCKTCLDDRFVWIDARRERCPSCDRDNVKTYGFQINGRLVGTKNQAELMLGPFKSMGLDPSIYIGRAGIGKTRFLRLVYNYHLNEIGFRERVFMSKESAIVRALQDGRFEDLRWQVGRAKVVIWDELGQPGTWAQGQGVQAVKLQGELFDLVDEILEKRKIFYAASNYDFRKTIPHEGIVRRLSESAKVVTL